jgi:prepilin-type N-terminal cleavage/methylation domain-containing protein
MQIQCQRSKRRGFTLVELLIVVVILVILALIAVPKFMNSAQRSREAALRSDLKLMRNGIELFTNDTGLNPLLLSDLSATTAPTHGADQTTGTSTALVASLWFGPYIYAIPNDPIDNTNDWSYTVAGATPPSGGTNAFAWVECPLTTTGLDGTVYNTW